MRRGRAVLGLALMVMPAMALCSVPVSAAAAAVHGNTTTATSGSWSSWESLGGILGQRPVAVSWGSGRIDVFVVGSDRTEWDDWYDASVSGSWHWTELGGGYWYTSAELAPATNFSDPGNIGLYGSYIDSAHALTVSKYANGTWAGPPGCIQGSLAAEPSGVIWSGSMDAYVEGTDHELWEWTGNLSGLSICGSWHPRGGLLSSAPAAVGDSVNSATEDTVFLRGTDMALWYWSSVTGWHDAGGKLASKPAAVAVGGGAPVAFVEGADGALWDYSTATGKWDFIGGQILGVPAVAATPPGSAAMDVLVEGTDHAIYHAGNDGSGSGWHWESLGGYTVAPPTAVSWAPGRIDIFMRGRDNALWHRFFAS